MTAAVGVDVGGTFVKAVRLTEDGRVEERLRRPTPPQSEEMLELVEDMAASLGPGLPVGVGLAGLVDHGRGVLVWGPHLPGEYVPVSESLGKGLGVEVFVDNDANCAVMGEHRLGAARGAGDVLMVTLGTGIGMGVLVEGRIYRGRAHAGEVGHITVEEAGEECACGRRGCWETKVSGRELEARAVSVLGPGRGASDLLESARAGHAGAAAAVEEAGQWLATGIEALVLAFDPALVVVGGAVVGDELLEPVRRRLSGTEGVGHRPPLPVRVGILGAESGAVGAAVCASEERG